MIKFVRTAAAAVALCAAAMPAEATIFRFLFTGAYDADFTMDTERPGAGYDFWNNIYVNRATGTFSGVAGSNVELVFYENNGLDIYEPAGGPIVDLYGDNLFNLPWSGRPIIETGNFDLQTSEGEAVMLRISDPDAVEPSVPEPATWAMMLGGFGAIGIGLRRRARPARA